MLRNPNEGLHGKISNMPTEAYHVSIYRTCISSYGTEKRKRPEVQPYILCLVCYLSCFCEGRQIFHIFSLPNLLTGRKGADLMIRANVVLKKQQALGENHRCSKDGVYAWHFWWSFSNFLARPRHSRRGLLC